MQLCRYLVSQSTKFYRHNPLCCFSTSVYCCCCCCCCCCCLFRYLLSPETFGHTLVQDTRRFILQFHGVAEWLGIQNVCVGGGADRRVCVILCTSRCKVLWIQVATNISYETELHAFFTSALGAVSGHLHAPVALFSGKEPLVPIG